MKKSFYFIISFILTLHLHVSAEDGYRLWLRYDCIEDQSLRSFYKTRISGWQMLGSSPILSSAENELETGLSGLLGIPVRKTYVLSNGTLVCGTIENNPVIRQLIKDDTESLGNDGYIIRSVNKNGMKYTVVAAKSDIGVLYGVFKFLSLIQTLQPIDHLEIINVPKTKCRILNHWDNLNRTVERGYAGFSLWDWHKLPDYIAPVYTDYARANASIGINGTVLTNVNANALVLTREYLVKVAALSDVFRKYGIKVYLTARFSAPIEIGGLKTADPLDPEVINWWNEKIEEIYKYIPDFGGFLVKANSEGQPGPQNYGRTHADGANMLADALKQHGGIVMWRAFVYDNNIPVDRAMQAYNEFVPLDGKFRENVLVQVKNGPIDFQPREPFHPLFGSMPKTPLMMEFQITQEYLGMATHLVYLAPLFQECLASDTWSSGKGSTVAKIVDGSITGYSITGMAGVSNIGNERNWTGHPIAQANWYAFGRLAWNPEDKPDVIAEDWIRMTFSNNEDVVTTVKQVMMRSREITVSYMTPLGLHHIMGKDHHYGPAPWINQGRPDWTSVYYHKADSAGIGFDRSISGSRATDQYYAPVKDKFNNLATCPENLLLWFHHVSWTYRLKSGKTLWDELCYNYASGADSVVWMQSEWQKLNGKIDKDSYEHVDNLLSIQVKEARWWRDACILYFRQFSKLPVPNNLPAPEKDLSYYQNLRFYFVPGSN